MLTSFRRLFVIYKGYWGKLAFSQVLLFISALCMIGVATLTQRLINEGIGSANVEVILQTGLVMIVLAIVAGLAMTGTAAYAVFFAQGTSYVLRSELYRKIETFSFSNFDRFRTGNLLVRLNSDIENIMRAVMYSVMMLLYAPFMVTIALILTIIRTPDLVWIMIAVIVVVLGIMALLVPAYSRLTTNASRSSMASTTPCRKISPACAWSKRSCARNWKKSVSRSAPTPCAIPLTAPPL